MTPVRHPDANVVLTAGMGAAGGLELEHRDGWSVTAWEPSPGELAIIAAGGKIWLSVLTKHPGVHPLVGIRASENPPAWIPEDQEPTPDPQ